MPRIIKKQKETKELALPEVIKPVIPQELPILLLTDAVIYPTQLLPLTVTEPQDIKLIDDVAVTNRIIGVLTKNKTEIPNIGTAAFLAKMLKLPDGNTQVLLQGIDRIKVINILQQEPFIKAKVEQIEEIEETTKETQAMLRNVITLFQKVVSLSPQLPPELSIVIMNLKSISRCCDFVAANINLSLDEQQEILQTIDLNKRLERIIFFLNREIEVLEIGERIQQKIKEKLGKEQREHLLREQLQAIQKELGELTDQEREAKELREKLDKLSLPPEVKEEVYRQINRLASIPTHAPEYQVLHTYLDWIVNLPWGITTEDNLNITEVEKILNEDHYNLDKVKKRIIEYLSVYKLKGGKVKGPILCFVGPPGVGKTSLGQSIARALKRKFVRISVGGVQDEAEIRGHRRTYVGALPGRIIQSIRRCASSNPVFMLDEIDKISTGISIRGDPQAALLELLDPEQNNKFLDHYLDIPFDLSKVMFITTANITDTILPALYDRMEILSLPGYTDSEKLQIAKNFIIPQSIEEHGLNKKYIKIEDEAILKIIEEYTREAGVRDLKRKIEEILRKIARKVAEEETTKEEIITKDNLHDYLGPIQYQREVVTEKLRVGVTTALAWSPSGGDIIFIETALTPGSGEILLTGQLGKVMEEEAKAALTYAKTYIETLKIETMDDIPIQDFFTKKDIHIHIPETAIKKDGPSAGIAIATALLSTLLNKPIRSDIAMTGEVTLLGNILKVGGIKEKVLAAHRSGVKEVILPQLNKNDLEDIPSDVKQNLKFHFVSHMNEVIKIMGM